MPDVLHLGRARAAFAGRADRNAGGGHGGNVLAAWIMESDSSKRLGCAR